MPNALTTDLQHLLGHANIATAAMYCNFKNEQMLNAVSRRKNLRLHLLKLDIADRAAVHKFLGVFNLLKLVLQEEARAATGALCC